MFNTVLHHRLFKYNIYSHISAPHKILVYPLPFHHTRAFKRLDIHIVKLMDKVDKTYKREITNRVRWSPENGKPINLV